MQPGVGYEISASFTDLFVRIGNTQIETLHRLVKDFASIAPGKAKKVFLSISFLKVKTSFQQDEAKAKDNFRVEGQRTNNDLRSGNFRLIPERGRRPLPGEITFSEEGVQVCI